ncbi:hypothetical protein ACIPW5_06425 [Streptomyces sp. NPDC090077]|uniref:hypothetical protein n=1 Tax=Streptomyces sp. NPDC090077 TaxID=3365938 RepID=UPI003800BF25
MKEEGLELTYDTAALPERDRAGFAAWLAANPKAARATIVLPPAAVSTGSWGWLRREYDHTAYRAGSLHRRMRERILGDPGPQTGFNAWDFWRMPDGKTLAAAAEPLRRSSTNGQPG